MVNCSSSASKSLSRQSLGICAATRGRLRALLAEAPAAIQTFEVLLRFVGWNDSNNTDSVAVRLNRIDWHNVNSAFPCLTAATAPNGVVEATYVVLLPLPSLTS